MAGDMPPIAHGEPDDEWGDPKLSFEVARPIGGADQLADAFADREHLNRALADKQARLARRGWRAKLASVLRRIGGRS